MNFDNIFSIHKFIIFIFSCWNHVPPYRLAQKYYTAYRISIILWCHILQNCKNIGNHEFSIFSSDIFCEKSKTHYYIDSNIWFKKIFNVKILHQQSWNLLHIVYCFWTIIFNCSKTINNSKTWNILNRGLKNYKREKNIKTESNRNYSDQQYTHFFIVS